MRRNLDVVGFFHFDCKTVEHDVMVDKSSTKLEARRDCFGEPLNFRDVAGNEGVIHYLGKKEVRPRSF